MERRDRATVAGFFRDGAITAGDEIRLPDDVARHAHVRRLRPGDAVRLTNGRGDIGVGETLSITAREFVVRVTESHRIPPPTPLHLVIPVADRDRMLFAAEKAVELQATHWHPTHFARSRDVSPRGEGEKFRTRLRTRMIAALEQSGGAWLPDVTDEHPFADRVGLDVPTRLLLDRTGEPIAQIAGMGPIAIAVGPEGGLLPAEIDSARAAGWRLASLAASTLRFETAAIAGAAVVRALQQPRRNR